MCSIFKQSLADVSSLEACLSSEGLIESSAKPQVDDFCRGLTHYSLQMRGAGLRGIRSMALGGKLT